jgi:hypothetical protein
MSNEQVRCPGCNGSGFLEHNEDGFPTQSCPFCQTIGTVRKSEADDLIAMGINDTTTPTVFITFEPKTIWVVRTANIADLCYYDNEESASNFTRDQADMGFWSVTKEMQVSSVEFDRLMATMEF